MAARAFWPEYAAAKLHEHYTLTMLFARLAVGALSVAGAACGATGVAGTRSGQHGGLEASSLLCPSLIPNHLYPDYVWSDYPVWYHLVYLSYLVPVAALTARLFRSLIHVNQIYAWHRTHKG